MTGTECALKCYPHKRRNSRAIYGDALYEDELVVYNLVGRLECIDVVVMPWIDGRTLDRLFGDPATNYHTLLSHFESFALDILRGERAHGDIKPENIVVQSNGEMSLIDFDSAWVPGFEQCDVVEAGTPFFSHPLREERRFDKSIDDFSIALMVTMLAALSYDRGTFAPHIDADCALFSPHAVVSGVDKLLNAALALFERKGDKKHRDIAATLYNCSGPIPSLLRLLEG
ncbi:MAG: hypothetical protein IKY20_05900 [Alistipes sp.]|nr:hypothetical protein [Alistipes sp.]